MDDQLTVWLENKKLKFRKFNEQKKIRLDDPSYRITQFCVSPSNAVILVLISRVFENDEITNQIALGRIFLNSSKKNYFFLTSFKDLPKGLIRVNHDEVVKKENEGYGVSYTHHNYIKNNVKWGMKNFISHFAIDDSGSIAIVSNNNAIYQLNLETKEVFKLKNLEEKIIGIGFNKSSNKIRYLFKNHCNQK